jgi:hypothetical protein
MAVPITPISIFRVFGKICITLDNLQFRMRDNAQAWKISAQAQLIPIATLAGIMNSAALSYQDILSKLQTFRLNDPSWPRIVTMYQIFGGVGQEFIDFVAPMSAVANQLGPAPKTTFAEIISACDQIIAAIDPRVNPWP